MKSLVIGAWKPADAHIIYEYNKTVWMDGQIFARWINTLNNKQRRKFAGHDKKAWLLLDNSSTHVLPEGAVTHQCSVSSTEYNQCVSTYGWRYHSEYKGEDEKQVCEMAS